MFQTPVQSDKGHMEFFHRSHGRRHIVGHASTIDNVILGRDIDSSGSDPHKAFMGKFQGYAGSKSGEKVVRPFRKPNIASASMIDTVVFGHDMDQSGPSPHAEAFESFKAKGAGGMQTSNSESYKPFRKPVYAMKSTMDEVMYGRDIDFSGENPHQKFTNTYSGHAGVATENRGPRPFRKQNCTSQSQMDEVIFGHDMDGSGPAPQKNYMMNNFKDHAGMKSEEKVTRPFRKPGIAQQAVVDDLIQDHDVDGSGPNVQFDHFTGKYQGHAGQVSGAGVARRTGKKGAEKESPAGKPVVCVRQQSRQVGANGGLKEEKPRWNGSTKAPPKATPTLSEGAAQSPPASQAESQAQSPSMQACRSAPALAFAPPTRTGPASNAGASEAGSSLPGSQPGKTMSKTGSSLPGTSMAGSRSARNLMSALNSVPEAQRTIRVE